MSDEENGRTNDNPTDAPGVSSVEDVLSGDNASAELDAAELRRRREAIDHTVEALCNRLAAGDPADEDVAAAVREADELVTLFRTARRDG